MLSAKVVRDAIDRMSMLRFFPAEAVGVAEVLNEMCSTDEQVAWLARRVTQLYDEWPGPHMLRSILCSKYPPADGTEAAGFDQRYPEGIPGESAGAPPMLSVGHVLQLDGERAAINSYPELTTTLEAAYAAMTGRNLARDRHRKAEEPPPAVVLPPPCPKCMYGRVAGGYCDCRIGQELARLGG